MPNNSEGGVVARQSFQDWFRENRGLVESVAQTNPGRIRASMSSGTGEVSTGVSNGETLFWTDELSDNPPPPPPPPTQEEWSGFARPASFSDEQLANVLANIRTREAERRAGITESAPIRRGRARIPTLSRMLNENPQIAVDIENHEPRIDGSSHGQMFGNVTGTTMRKVASFFGMSASYPTLAEHPLIVGTNLAGVEIELENMTVDSPRFNYWTAKGDGSLRNNGMEFVFSSPWGGKDLYNAACEIDGFLFSNNPDSTWRCSTHVHVDVRNMTVPQLKKMILAYIFYERVLFRCSGWHRYKNNFCVALGFAQNQLNDLGNWWNMSDSDFVQMLSGSWDKYTAMNTLPMSSFGSVEFRISEAKWHKGQLIRLVNRFLSLKEIAMANDGMTDTQFIEMLMSANPTEIIRKGIPKGMDDFQHDLEIGYKLAHDVLSMAKLRNRTRPPFLPNVEDGTRVLTGVEVFAAGWNHCRSYLDRHFPEYSYPRDIGDTITFGWIYQVQQMMTSLGRQFDVEWFLPSTNRRQLQRLYANYVSSMAPAPMPSFQEEDDEEEHHSDDDGEFF